MKNMRSLESRLWEKVDRTGGNEACWPHTINQPHNVYASIFDPDAANATRIIGMHVAAYKVTYGDIPQDLWVLHKCPNGNRNKRCCNPAHLYLGTHRDNTLDAMDDGVLPQGIEHHKAKLSPEDAKAIRLLYGTWSPSKLAKHFGVSQATLSSILHGEIWKDAGGPLKESTSRAKTHCHKGHPLTESNIVMSHGGNHRNCKICHDATALRKEQRRRQLLAERGPIQRAKRRDHFENRLSKDTLLAIRTEHAHASYRELAEKYNTSYSTIKNIIDAAVVK